MITQISLIASFFAGMVALFAPCCISYLFPAYVGNIFREQKKVLLMTFIYSLGIFTVMLPIVLGAKVISNLFMQWHDQTYLFGAIVMMIVAILTFLGIKLPMPHLQINQQANNNKLDIPATYSLGLVAGITSACCAPVLIGVLTLSSFSPTVLLSLGVGFSYVLGMVTPLYIASLFIKKRNVLDKPILRKKILQIQFGSFNRPVFVSNLVGAGVFFLSGLVMFILTVTGQVSMPTGEDSVTKSINQVALTVTDFTNRLPFIDILFIGGVIYFIYKVIRNMGVEKKQADDSCCQHSKEE